MGAGADRSGSRPLAGLRVVVTRPRNQAESLVAGLERLGAEVVAAPLIRIVDPVDPEPLRRAVADVGDFDWIIFTSANGVRQFWEFLRRGEGRSQLPPTVSICTVGPSTAAAAEAEGAHVDLVPDEYVAESAVQALKDVGVPAGTKVLVPQADLARRVLAKGLKEIGLDVVEVTAYRTVPDEGGIGLLRRLFESGHIDLITFTSGSAVRNFAQFVSSDLSAMEVASIGPITSAAMAELGWRVTIEAKEHTAEGLLQAIEWDYRSSIQ